MTGVKRVVYASSGCSIYGHGAPLPLREEFMSMHLSTPYQITKMLGELYCNFFCNHHGLKVVKPRFFNSYGPGPPTSGGTRRSSPRVPDSDGSAAGERPSGD